MLSRLYAIRHPCLLRTARCTRSFSSINNDENLFFLIEPNIKEQRDYKKPKRIQDEDARDFKKLLDSLFDSHLSTPPKTPPPPKGDIIQDSLMELILKKQHVYREKAPIPKNLATVVFDDSAEIEHESTKKISGLSSDERIIEKEKENKVIHSILSTKTELDLLKVVSEEIDKGDYPRYYPNILVKAMEHATFRFKDPYLAITIFERAKQKSLTSYITGCNTDAYNTILKVRWDTFGDVYGALETLEEMTVNGIKSNNESRDIVATILPKDTFFWNDDEQRACNMMKEMVAKWKV